MGDHSKKILRHEAERAQLKRGEAKPDLPAQRLWRRGCDPRQSMD